MVSDFRPADWRLGGQGAPLVPLLDYVAFHHPTRNRVLQNLGGIANLTVIPAGAPPEAIFAFDTGPANMVIDALMTECFGKKYDAQGGDGEAWTRVGIGGRTYLRGRFFLGASAEICRKRSNLDANLSRDFWRSAAGRASDRKMQLRPRQR